MYGFQGFTNGYRSADRIFEEAYDWLSPLAGIFENRQTDTFNLEGRQDGLGNWLVETAQFKRWINGTGEILYCCGQRRMIPLPHPPR